ncbi:MTAP family purine nucleoside phosphorylase [Agromyces sp. SYSU T00194]|uniref:MTAP family purine nucleoside phosphorylase n=1 Tax=Agromyces chitinivorans TaxID=3158560 RepID=UPI0033958952
MTASAPGAHRAEIGVIGGSGLYALLDDDATQVEVATPYGAPSGPIAIGELAGRRVAFLSRHGAGHVIPPHRLNFRANVWALASLGVRAIVTSAAVGGLVPEARPGRFALPDQFIDRTWNRPDTFYDGPSVQHLAAADPFCPELRRHAASALSDLGEDAMTDATTVVIQGPRFSTRAESRMFRAMGAHLVNMTQYPEVVLAAELGVGAVNLSFVTDTDAGDAAGEADAVDPQLVLDRMAAAEPRIRAAITAMVAAVPADYAARQFVDPAAVAAVLALPPAEG